MTFEALFVERMTRLWRLSNPVHRRGKSAHRTSAAGNFSVERRFSGGTPGCKRRDAALCWDCLDAPNFSIRKQRNTRVPR